MWARVLAAAVGIWLMAAPAVLGFGGAAADAHRILGPLAVTFAVVAMAQSTRPVRWCNAAVGAALAIVAVAVGELRPSANLLASGAALAGLSLVRGRITDRFGGGWSAVWRGGRAPG